MLAGLVVASGTAAELAVATPVAPLRRAAAVTIASDPDPSIVGERVLIVGRVFGFRHRVRMTLWQRLEGERGFRPVAAASTDPGGRYRFVSAPGTNRVWFVAARGLGSRMIDQHVRARVSLSATPDGAAVRFAGVVGPSHAGETISLERHAAGRWIVFARLRLDRASGFAMVRQFSVPAAVRAVFAGDDRNAWSSSAELMIGQPTVGATLGVPAALSADRFGVNADYSGAALFSTDLAGEYADLAALRPGTLRWPGGTGADYFQWQLGYGLGQQHGFQYTLQDLEAAYKATGAPPIFDLNVMTSDLASQEQMLHTAQGLGLPIKYIELGNELYLSDADYVQHFPTATTYGRTVATYVIALHRDFPGALVAAVGAFDGGTPRERTWNHDVLTTAQQAGGLPDALTLHVKPRWDAPVPAGVLPTLFGEPYQDVRQANAVMAALPHAEPAWITEYNLFPDSASNPAQRTYAHTLLVAENALLLQQITESTLTDYWTTFSGSANSAYIPSVTGAPALTPAGLALQWIQTAATGATATTPITFGGGPALSPGGPPALVGYQFSDRRDVVVNLSSQAVVAPAGAAIPAGLPYQQVSGDPTQSVTYASQLVVTDGTVGDTLALPAYSITLVG